MRELVTVALDAMGGDHGPVETVAGARLALDQYPYIAVVLVGNETVLSPMIGQDRASGRLSIRHASEIVGMDEAPAQAVRSRPDNSMSVAARMVRSGEAQAFVTPGNTGAALAAAMFEVGRVRGVRRPALGIVMPSLESPYLLLDVGANTEVRPGDLVQFGIMGSIYAERLLGAGSPRVSLVSNGEEDVKGSELVKEAHQLMHQAPIRFVGNIEGSALPNGQADVVVTDGFTGNVLIKTAEGVVSLVTGVIRRQAEGDTRSKVGAWLLRPGLRKALAALDYNEVGGAQLLGVNGAVVVGHGRSKRQAIASLVHAGAETARRDVVLSIAEAVAATAAHEEDSQ